MNQRSSRRFPAPPKAWRAVLLCAALVPLAAACGGNKSSGTSAVGAAAGSTHASSAAAAAAASSAAPSAASNASVGCPSAAAVSAAAGSTYPAPKAESADGDTTCNYSDASTGANLNCVIAPSTGITASDLQGSIASQAKATGGAVKQLSGLGTSAFIFTEDDASTNSDGIATTMVGAISSSLYVICGGELAPAGAEAVTRLVLAE